ncbi:MAG TPA: N-acetyldiaminopimelate deacetylase [Ligilactobacillus acidipiscis]|uniref:N-acetyldiaminopimelate deacetylase n=1 Tax=Ligilactobacillus acidipiscis TaxID=89059 RepID=A0A921FA10_9LACO|nr:N-acetyldiaminopimelate deacetylase [Ligilactobacillus acidipiscis]
MIKMQNLLQIYQDLHQIPEIGMEEFETQQKLLTIISQMPQDFLEVRTWKTAILVHVVGQDTSHTIGYRTDIDALPVTEKTGLSFASKHPGKMHACGHDLHMTVALGILAKFAEKRPAVSLTFIFQPAEENASGGKQLYESDVLGSWLPDEIYALHDNPDLPAGAIGCRQGTLFAGTCEIHIKFSGKSGHAAFPHQANDMVVCGAEFVSQLQTIVSRRIDPVKAGVVTIGHLEAGTTGNVIAGQCQVDGTIRALTQEVNVAIQQEVRRIAEGIAHSFACQVDIDLHQGGYFPVENNENTTAEIIKYFKSSSLQYIETAPAMTGEDFGFWLSKIPGTMCWLGVDSPYSLHSDQMAPDTAAIGAGVRGFSGFLDQRAAQLAN